MKVISIKFEEAFINNLTGSLLLDNYVICNEGNIVKHNSHYYTVTSKNETIKTDPGERKSFRVIK